jgi:Fic family protein
MNNEYKPPFRLTTKIVNLVVKITELIVKAETILNFDRKIKLRKQNRIKTISSTLAIEGNTLTIEQISAIIEGKKVLGTEKEINEVLGAIEAYEYIDNYDPYSMKDFLNAHKLMMGKLLENAGMFRRINVGIRKGNNISHIAPDAIRIGELMKALFEWFKHTELNPLISSSVFHYEVEFIHPFIDGNGRMGRLWQTVILSNYKPIFKYLPLESIIRDNQDGYYNALENCDKKGECSEFVEFILKCILDVLESSVKNSDKSSVKTETKTLYIIKSNPKITLKEIASILNLSTRAVEKQVSKLKKENKLRRVGSRKDGFWEVVSEI